MYARDRGLTVSLLAAAAIGLCYYFALGVRYRDLVAAEGSGDSAAGEPSTRGLAVLAPAAGGLGAFAAAFCLLFAVLNPLLQVEEITRAEIDSQLRDGILVLRLATIPFALVALKESYVQLRGKAGKVEYSAEVAVSEKLTTEQRRARDSAQTAVLLAALFLMWLMSADRAHSLALALLAYVFTYINDDWLVMSAYSKTLKGRLFRWDTIRLNVANALLLVPLAVIAWNVFRWWGIVIWYLVTTTLVMSLIALHVQGSRNVARRDPSEPAG